MHFFIADILFQQENQKDLIIALLTAEGCEGIEEINRHQLKAFFSEKHTKSYWEKILISLSRNFQLQFDIKTLQNKDWAKDWHQHFNPLIEGQVGIRASFHPSLKKQVQYDICIDPGMAFGTGHHTSTLLMVRAMQLFPFKAKRVLDLGCGTGILSILASKLGACHISAIDTDDKIKNIATNNFILNKTTAIDLDIGSIEDLDHQVFHIILANINKQLIESTSNILRNKLYRNGRLLISGIQSEESDSVNKKLVSAGFTKSFELFEEEWVCSLFTVQ